MRLLMLMLVFSSVVSRLGHAQEDCIPGRKVRKQIKQVIGDTHTLHPVAISLDELPNYREGDCIYRLLEDGKVTGFVLTTRAPGRYDYFDYSIVYEEDLRVLDVRVLVYRSSQGYGIAGSKWLRQFKGYHGQDWQIGKEIDAISGSTISANALAEDMKRCHQLMQQALLRLQEISCSKS